MLSIGMKTLIGLFALTLCGCAGIEGNYGQAYENTYRANQASWESFDTQAEIERHNFNEYQHEALGMPLIP